MDVPEYLHQHVGQFLAIETDGADRRRLWAVVLGLVPVLDGNKWCVLWGENIQSGVAGFGNTPVEAIQDFEQEMYKKIDERR